LIGERVICDLNESIIQHFVSNPALLQLVCQPVVRVEIELQPKGTPSRDAQIAQSQLFVQEVEIVGHTFAGVRFQIGFAGHFVMPRTIRSTAFHRAKDMHQAWLFAALVQDFLNPGFLAKILIAHKFDLYSVGLRQRFGILSNPLAQRLGKLGIVEDANALLIQIMRHALGVTEGLQTAREHNAVIATQHAI